jgi:polyhydroxyalkanoate synthesis regulator phasin
MKDMIEKGILTTLGFWLLVHEKADEIIKEMIEKGKIAPEEGKHFLDELSQRVDDEKEVLKKKFSSTAETTLSQAGLATKKDLDQLAARLKKIETRLDALEGKKQPAKTKK